jgi:hypothetical protein
MTTATQTVTLTLRQRARPIVHEALHVTGLTVPVNVSDDDELSSMGALDLQSLASHLTAAAGMGRLHLRSGVDMDFEVGNLATSTSVGTLIDTVAKLMEPVYCTNPGCPHEQSAPYPAKCWCGFDVQAP